MHQVVRHSTLCLFNLFLFLIFLVPGNVFIADYANNRIRKVMVVHSIAALITPSIMTNALASSPPSTSPTVTPSSYPSLSPSTMFIITTLAGTGFTTYNGDNGQATAATLYYPCGVALNSAGIFQYH